MKINVRRCDAKYRLINGGYWHHWFAWHPVKVGHKWVWLEAVMRRRVWWFCMAGCGCDSFYKLPNTKLTGAGGVRSCDCSAGGRE